MSKAKTLKRRKLYVLRKPTEVAKTKFLGRKNFKVGTIYIKRTAHSLAKLYGSIHKHLRVWERRASFKVETLLETP